jgi:hypothetical protein
MPILENWLIYLIVIVLIVYALLLVLGCGVGFPLWIAIFVVPLALRGPLVLVPARATDRATGDG